MPSDGRKRCGAAWIGYVSWDVDGVEMMVWGNYCNVLGGASPVNIYYSIDGGRTVKIAYTFGQSPYFRDNGSEGGGATGTLLGNPDNPVHCRHIHTVAYNPAENAFYASTGDADRPEGYECHWLRGTYDATKDQWHWKVIVSDTMLFNPGVESGNMIIQDGVILASHCAPASPLATGFIVSLDLGKTWAQYDLKEFGRRSPTRFHEKNGEGWFRVDLRSGWIKQVEVLFIKPKPAPAGTRR
jgi:hypothetical protein